MKKKKKKNFGDGMEDMNEFKNREKIWRTDSFLLLIYFKSKLSILFLPSSFRRFQIDHIEVCCYFFVFLTNYPWIVQSRMNSSKCLFFKWQTFVWLARIKDHQTMVRRLYLSWNKILLCCNGYISGCQKDSNKNKFYSLTDFFSLSLKIWKMFNLVAIKNSLESEDKQDALNFLITSFSSFVRHRLKERPQYFYEFLFGIKVKNFINMKYFYFKLIEKEEKLKSFMIFTNLNNNQ